MNLKAIALFVTLLAAPVLHAQGQVDLRLLAFSADLNLDETFVHDPAVPDSPSVKGTIKTYLNDEFIKVPLTTRKVAFTTKADSASLTREGELIGEVTLPADVRTATLLFLPGGGSGKSKCVILTINDSKRAFPAGSYNATNLSPLPVRLRLESKNYDFKPGQNLIIEDAPTREGGRIGMHAYAFEDNAWKPIGAGLWSHPGRARKVLVMFMNPEAKAVQLRSYADGAPREPQAAAAVP